MATHPIILTRPADRIDDMLDQLSNCKNPIHVAPLMTISPADPMPEPDLNNADLNNGRDGVIISSRRVFDYAPDGFIQSYADLPFYLVGDTTADRARQENLTIAATANTMADLMPKLPIGGDLIYLCGSHTQYDLAVDHQVVYESRAVKTCPTPLHEFSGRPAILPIYSQRTADILTRFVIQDDLVADKWHFICMSDTVADPISHIHTDDITIPTVPTGNAMITAITHISRC